MGQPALIDQTGEEKSTNGRPKKEERTPSALDQARTQLRELAERSPDGAAELAELMFFRAKRYERPAWEKAFLEQARPIDLPFRDRALAAWQWGEAGPAVLLVHGWEGRGAQLGATAPRLAALGYRVFAFDAPAHGDSAGNWASLFDFATAIEAAADHFGPLHAVIAHSMGGAALAWAGRDRRLAKRYAMIAPPTDVREFTGWFGREMGLSDLVLRRMEARIEARYGVPLADVRVTETAPRQDIPLLVIHDAGDKDVPIERGRAVAEAWPGARFVRTDGLGHRRILHDPDVLEILVRYVAFATLP